MDENIVFSNFLCYNYHIIILYRLSVLILSVEKSVLLRYLYFIQNFDDNLAE